MTRGHTSGLPSGPKTNDEPTYVKSRMRVITRPAAWKTARPASVFSTTSANRNCRPSPQPTVR